MNVTQAPETITVQFVVVIQQKVTRCSRRRRGHWKG